MLRKCSICNKKSKQLYFNNKYPEPICEECVNKILEELNKTSKHRIYIEDEFFPTVESDTEVTVWQP